MVVGAIGLRDIELDIYIYIYIYIFIYIHTYCLLKEIMTNEFLIEDGHALAQILCLPLYLFICSPPTQNLKMFHRLQTQDKKHIFGH